jgi:AcrR family transcriptional regulator
VDTRTASAVKRTRLQPEARRGQLLEVAIVAFGARPYEEVTIADVAEAAGVSKGLVFNYFDSKRELFREVLRLVASRADLASDPDPELSAPERFRTGLERFVAIVAKLPHLLPPFGGDPEAREYVEAAYDAIADRMITRMGVSSTPRLRHAVLAWIEFVRTTTASWVTDHPITRDELIELQIVTFRAAANTALGPEAPRAALP